MEKAEQKEWNLWEIYDDTQLQELEKLNEAYKAFLDAGKTERECVTEIVRQAEAAGYRDLYKMCIRDRYIRWRAVMTKISRI